MEVLREYCMEHGERRVMERGEKLEEAGEPAQWMAFVKLGCFKYMVHNNEENKDYCIKDYFLPRGDILVFQAHLVTSPPTYTRAF